MGCLIWTTQNPKPQTPNKNKNKTELQGCLKKKQNQCFSKSVQKLLRDDILTTKQHCLTLPWCDGAMGKGPSWPIGAAKVPRTLAGISVKRHCHPPSVGMGPGRVLQTWVIQASVDIRARGGKEGLTEATMKSWGVCLEAPRRRKARKSSHERKPKSRIIYHKGFFFF